MSSTFLWYRFIMLYKVQVLTFESVDEILKVLMIHDYE